MADPRGPTLCAAHAELVGQQEEIMAQVIELRRDVATGLSAAGAAVSAAREDATTQVSLLAGRLGAIEHTSAQILDHVLQLKRADDSGPAKVLAATNGNGHVKVPWWVFVAMLAGALVVGAAVMGLLGPQRTGDLTHDALRRAIPPAVTPVVTP